MSSPRSSQRHASLSRACRLVMVAMLCGLLTACTGIWPFDGLFVRTSTPTMEEVPAALEPYYHQVLEWRPCGLSGAECSLARAPLDWDNPGDGREIELALTRYRANGERYGSLLTNPGGPGGSGVEFVRDSPDFVVSNSVREHLDLVGWDPRGVGSSTAVNCGTDRELDEYFFGEPVHELNTPEGDAERVAATQAFVQRCAELSGELLAHIDTVSTTRDLDMLRAALGDRKLRYLGYSYGSDIGAWYAELFPDTVGSMVLDGATDSSIGLFETGLAQLRGFTQALESYLADCVQAPECFYSGTVPDGIAMLQDIFDRLDEAPLRTDDGRAVDSTFLYTAIQTALYDEETWPYITAAVNEVQLGQVETATLLTDFAFSRDENGTYSDNSRVAFIAIMCVDYPVTRDPDEIARQNELVRAASPFRVQLSELGDVECQNWPYPARDRPAVLTGSGAAPILIVATTGDPATPYEWGVALADQLESAVLLTYEGEGHVAYDEGDPCVTTAVDEYLLRGTVPDDLRCPS